MGTPVCDANHECFYANANRTLYVDVTNPDIEFHSSSVANNTKRATYYNNAYINTTITEASNNMSAFIDWNRSLVGYWRLENTNGTWFADSSTWGNNGTCTTTARPNLTTGMRGKAYRFDGSNDGISTVSTARSGSASMFAWIYQPSTAGTDCTGEGAKLSVCNPKTFLKCMTAACMFMAMDLIHQHGLM